MGAKIKEGLTVPMPVTTGGRGGDRETGERGKRVQRKEKGWREEGTGGGGMEEEGKIRGGGEGEARGRGWERRGKGSRGKGGKERRKPERGTREVSG